ncbi:methionyl-tRNA formyltransferase [Flagellimonas lutaonensis]|uniref:Methionyl-tRNA formyltransferase n=1 Tax=Flagellimonas lutaonensis TaxID=516051 RepID=A0A0D5YUZ3_9FLAO|nr:methionyl-tRNA formyltransferase [Allomuricauda lutaonensis]AKA36137.1 Methionyl-tRNA formyltransferase [Allomuricauda lutaonensis]
MTSQNNEKDLRIVFMGTPEFAVSSLKKLVERRQQVVGVITAPDRPAGRGRKLQESAVKKYAKQEKLPILQPSNLKDPYFLKELEALNANLQVVVAFRMLPKVVWQMPQYGTFNLHASLLPEYRGAAPINWAIINGETQTGVTTFFIDEKIDTGEIILQKSTPIGPQETAGELHDRLAAMGAELVLETVEKIAEGNVQTTQQEVEGELKLAPKIFKETCQIDWHDPLESIHNKIRGLSPYPGAWTTLFDQGGELTLKIYKAVPEPSASDQPVGAIVFGPKEMKVAVKNGFLKLKEIQLAGKRKMTVTNFLNGHELSKKAYVR